MAKDLKLLFSPRSVAVIGASRSSEKVGSIVLRNILNSKFGGKVFAVNPNASYINDIQCYPDVLSLPEVPDLAVIAIPSFLVGEVLNQIGEKGIKNVVVFSSGFKEIGEEGKKLEDDLLKIADKYGLNILGPNCLGFVNNNCPLNVTFGQSNNLNGNLRFVSQSGAIAASLFDWCISNEVGFSYFVTLGNKTIIDENDVLSYFKDDLKDGDNFVDEGLSSVSPIGMYLESIDNGQEFLRLVSEIGRTNPIFVLKPGKTKAAAVAMQSHTGSIAGEDSILEAAFRQVGIIRAETLEDFFDLARAFSWEESPNGPRLAIVSNAGGPAVISADFLVKVGLELADFSEETKRRLSAFLPRSSSIVNPVDILGDALADRYIMACEAVLETNQADSLLVILTPQMMTQVEKTAQAIGDLSKKYKKPIFCSFIGGQMVYEGEKILNRLKIPSFRFPERAISTIGAMWWWKKSQKEQSLESQSESFFISEEKRKQIDEIIEQAERQNQKSLDSLQADKIVSLFDIPTPATSQVSDLREARDFIDKNGWPVVLKITSPFFLHKASLGGVVTDIWDDKQLEFAWDKLNHKLLEFPESFRNQIKFQIQKDVVNGVEVIVGIRKDETFGWVLLFGAGGSFAEILADKNIWVLPIDINRIKKLVEGSKVFRLLEGSPGELPYALEKLYELILKFTHLKDVLPQATDIEINPVIVTHNDVWAVDCKIVLREEEKKVKTPKFHTAKLLSRKNLASKFHYFEFETDEPLIYQPGQYISVKVAPDRINSYSIAGSQGERRFYLLIDTSPGGVGSKFFENIKVDDKIAYLGPFGTFTFRENDGAKRLLFLGTGSGCSPLRSILEGALKKLGREIPIHFYFGLRYTSDVFWKDYFEKLASEYPNLHFDLVLSKPDESWHGEVGHITDVLKKEVPDASESSAYLCGNPAMIEEATKILLESNCPKERIYTEKF